MASHGGRESSTTRILHERKYLQCIIMSSTEMKMPLLSQKPRTRIGNFLQTELSHSCSSNVGHLPSCGSHVKVKHDKSDPLFQHVISRECVREIAKEQDLDASSSIGEFATKIGLDSLKRPWLENREVQEEGSICLEVINTFHDPIFVPLVRSEQVVTFAKQSLSLSPGGP